MILDTRPDSSTAAKPVKIGYLLRMYPRFSQTFVVNEILELERQGLDLEILSLRKPTDGRFHESFSRVQAQAHYIPESFREDPARTLRMMGRRLRKTPGDWLRALRVVRAHRAATWTDLAQAVHVLKWAKKHAINHLHVHFGTNEATVAMLTRMLGGPTYSLTLHAFDIFRDNVDRRLLAAKINGSAFTITVTEYNRRFLCQQIPGVDPEKVRVNYNGIDLEKFQDQGCDRTPNTIFGVARLVEKKGYRYLVDAVAQLAREGHTVQCTIAGDGPELAGLRRQVEQAGLQDAVHLPGAMTQDQVCEQLQQAACFVLPCIEAKDGNIDALPTVLLESLACGCPTISTRISGVPEIIEHAESGMLVDPADAAAVADALRSVLDGLVPAAALSAGGRRRAEARFDICRNVGTMREWLLSAAGGAARLASTPAANSGHENPAGVACPA